MKQVKYGMPRQPHRRAKDSLRSYLLVTSLSAMALWLPSGKESLMTSVMLLLLHVTNLRCSHKLIVRLYEER